MIAAAPRLSLLLGVAILACAGAAAWPWVSASPQRAVPAVRDPRPLPRLPATPPEADFAEIVQRPLFSLTRRPPAPAQPAPPRATAQSFRLEGLVLVGSDRRALIRESGRDRVLTVREGDVVGRWTVRRIERDRVLLESASEKLVLGRSR